jgi:hypothetical protein
MHARSLLGSTRAIDQRLDALLESNRLRAVPTASLEPIHSTLDDIVVLLSGCSPVPDWRTPDPEDETLAALLRAMYADADESTPVGRDVADHLDGGPPAVEALVESGRIRRAGEYLVVPLDGAVAGANWRVLLEVLTEGLSTVREKAVRLQRRLRADGVEAGTHTRRTFDRVTDRLRVLEATLVRLDAHASRVGCAVEHDRQLVRALRGVLWRLT